MQPPAQELVARDLHDNAWTFRHIYRGKHIRRPFNDLRFMSLQIVLLNTALGFLTLESKYKSNLNFVATQLFFLVLAKLCSHLNSTDH